MFNPLRVHVQVHAAGRGSCDQYDIRVLLQADAIQSRCQVSCLDFAFLQRGDPGRSAAGHADAIDRPVQVRSSAVVVFEGFKGGVFARHMFDELERPRANRLADQLGVFELAKGDVLHQVGWHEVDRGDQVFEVHLRFKHANLQGKVIHRHDT